MAKLYLLVAGLLFGFLLGVSPFLAVEDKDSESAFIKSIHDEYTKKFEAEVAEAKNKAEVAEAEDLKGEAAAKKLVERPYDYMFKYLFPSTEALDPKSATSVSGKSLHTAGKSWRTAVKELLGPPQKIQLHIQCILYGFLSYNAAIVEGGGMSLEEKMGDVDSGSTEPIGFKSELGSKALISVYLAGYVKYDDDFRFFVTDVEVTPGTIITVSDLPGFQEIECLQPDSVFWIPLQTKAITGTGIQIEETQLNNGKKMKIDIGARKRVPFDKAEIEASRIQLRHRGDAQISTSVTNELNEDDVYFRVYRTRPLVIRSHGNEPSWVQMPKEPTMWFGSRKTIGTQQTLKQFALARSWLDYKVGGPYITSLSVSGFKFHFNSLSGESMIEQEEEEEEEKFKNLQFRDYTKFFSKNELKSKEEFGPSLGNHNTELQLKEVEKKMKKGEDKEKKDQLELTNVAALLKKEGEEKKSHFKKMELKLQEEEKKRIRLTFRSSAYFVKPHSESSKTPTVTSKLTTKDGREEDGPTLSFTKYEGNDPNSGSGSSTSPLLRRNHL